MPDTKISDDPVAALASSTIFPVVSVAGASRTNEITTYAALQAAVKAATILAIDVRDYGTLGTANDTSIIQAAIDAAAAAGGGTVVLPVGSYNCANVKLKTKVRLVGQGRATRLIAIAGATGGVIELFDVDVERAGVFDLWIEGNVAVATLSGISFVSTGGSWSGGGTENVLVRVVATNTGEHGFYIKDGTATKLLQCRTRSATLDGFHLDATDCHVVSCSCSPAGRHGIHVLQHVNIIAGLKLGETTSHAVYFASGAHTCVATGIMVDACTGDGVRVAGVQNRISAAVSRPTGSGFHLESTAARNVISGVAANQGGAMPYGVVIASGATNNSIDIGAKDPVSGLLSGSADDNFVVVNGVPFSSPPISAKRFRGSAGTPTENVSGGRIPIWVLGTNGDEIAASFVVPPRYRGRTVQFTVLYHGSAGDATKNIQFTYGLGSLNIGAFVTEVDVTQSDTVSAPATANILTSHTCTVNLTLGASAVLADLTIKRDAATNITGNLLIQEAYMKLVS
jgi:hypothetical protein